MQQIDLIGHYFKIVRGHCLGRTPFVRDITSLKDMNEAGQGGWELMGEQLVKEKKLGLEILPLSIKSSKHDIFVNLL